MAASAPQDGNESPRNPHLDQLMVTSTSSGGPRGSSGDLSDSASAGFGAATATPDGGPEGGAATSTPLATHSQQESVEGHSTDSSSLAPGSPWSTQVARALISGIDNHEVTEPMTTAIGSVLPGVTRLRYIMVDAYAFFCTIMHITGSADC